MPFRSPLVDLRMPLLQATYVSTLHPERLREAARVATTAPIVYDLIRRLGSTGSAWVWSVVLGYHVGVRNVGFG
jgi:hypothetical protein